MKHHSLLLFWPSPFQPLPHSKPENYFKDLNKTQEQLEINVTNPEFLLLFFRKTFLINHSLDKVLSRKEETSSVRLNNPGYVTKVDFFVPPSHQTSSRTQRQPGP